LQLLSLPLHPHVLPLHALPLSALLQSPPLLHPHVPLLRHRLPSGELPQSVAQVPPEQQPPLHVANALQEVEHVLPLQADPVGQSPGAPHPQTPAVHLFPLDEPEQSAHVPPDGAQAEFPMVAHMPELQQKPDPQVPSEPPPQLALQLPFAPHVGFWPLHVAQVLPLLPQAELSPPATQMLPLQHPPLQVRPPAHDVVQTCALHA